MNAPNWDDVRYFLAVARGGSLSAAARVLDVQHSTVARRLSAFEHLTGVRLFDRLARGWALTHEGRALLVHAERLEQQTSAFARAAFAATREAIPVRISAPPAFASHFLIPRLAPRLAARPEITIDLVGEVRVARLAQREADIAVRSMRPIEPGLATRRLGQLAFRLYAHKAVARTPEADWRFLGYGDALGDVPHQRALATIAGPRPFVLRSNDLVTLYHACRAGMGFAMLPRFLTRTGDGLVDVRPDDDSLVREIWVVIHPDVRRAPRVRRVVDLLAAVIRDDAEALSGRGS